MKSNNWVIVSLIAMSVYNCYGQWASTSGPIVGVVSCMSTSGTKIFAGTDRGVFVSSDDGKTWIQTSLMNRLVTSICSVKKVLLATGDFVGILKSTNEGTTWSNIFINNKQGMYHIVSDGSNYYATSENNLYISTDEGNNWELVLLETKYIISIACSGSNIYVGTMKNGFFFSTNGGKNWEHLIDNKKDINFITADGTEIFFVTKPNIIYHTFDFGQIWNKFKFVRRWVSSISFIGSNVLVGCDSGVYVSTNYGEKWLQTSLKNFSVFTFLQMDSKIFCGTLHGGVYFSTNNGLNWEQTSLINLEIQAERFNMKEIQGTWEDFVAPPLMAGDMVFLEFAVDSFYYKNIRFGCVYEKPCSPYVGKEYSSGTYVIDDSLLYFQGNWIDNPCNSGKFIFTYKYNYYSDHMLEMDLIEPSQPPRTGIKSKLFLFKK